MPAPLAMRPLQALASATLRWMSSSASGQVEAHAALCGVHRFCHAEAERPEVAAIGEGGVPVEDGVGDVGGAERVETTWAAA